MRKFRCLGKNARISMLKFGDCVIVGPWWWSALVILWLNSRRRTGRLQGSLNSG
ncbi:hypothetical protein LINGRAPRIM_LOCUS1458 [Linum grandiflorum]